MNLIKHPLSLAVLFSVIAAAALALPVDPNLVLDNTYGLQPREGHTYFASPEDWRDINIYQLFTDRFADGADNTYISNKGWFVGAQTDSYARDRHHGGDWKGLKDNLDYLSGMGVRAVWISGVQKNEQGRDTRFTPYHQYHPTDFFSVDPAMGTFQDLKDLIDACHARGIYVILDVVINHTADLNGLWGNDKNDDKAYWAGGNGSHGWWDGRRHPYPFNDLSHFHNNGTINNWDSWPEYLYGQFKGTDDLKTESSHVSYWITEAFKNLIDATDCDGFRVDAIKHVEYNWVKQWADNIRKHAASKGKNDFIMFGEYFTYDNNTLASHCKEEGYSFNSALFFPMSQNIKSVFVDGQWSGQLSQQLNNIGIYGEGAKRLVTFIDNHDVNRIGLQAGGDVGHIEWIMPPALTFLYTATPVPCLYYGTEHAFQQGGHWNGSAAYYEYDDADWQRECMFDRGFQPGPAQGNKLQATNAKLYQHIKKLNEARAAHQSLTRGNFTERWQTGGRGPYAYTRIYGDEEALVAFSTTMDGNASATISPQVSKPEGTEFTNVLNTSEKVKVSSGKLTFSVKGMESKIFVSAPTVQPSEASWTLGASGDTTQLAVTYTPNNGPLEGASAINVLVSIDGGAAQSFAMTNSGGTWSYTYNVPAGAQQATLVFQDANNTGTTDSAGAWSNLSVVYTPPVFTIDGTLDSANYEIASNNGMKLWAARKGSKLYVATWSANGGGYDHFLYVANNFGNPETNTKWSKVGNSNFWFGGWPWLAGEGGSAYCELNNGGASGRVAMGSGGNVLEAEIDLVETFGSVPKTIYLAVVACGDADGSGLAKDANGKAYTVPVRWSHDGNDIAITDMLAVNTDAIVDSDTDGFFDGGRPEMRTIVDGNERDANYDLRRFYIDELAKESAEITVKFKPNTDPGDAVSNVHVYTNLNRRDFAVLEEDPTMVSTTSNTYFRDYAMTGPDGDGYYSATLPVSRCGAYRLQVRYRVNGNLRYYTDNALRRDCAVVVSPKKVLRTNMYEPERCSRGKKFGGFFRSRRGGFLLHCSWVAGKGFCPRGHSTIVVLFPGRRV